MKDDRASDTALGVALGMAAAARDPVLRDLLPPDYVAHIDVFLEGHSDFARQHLADLRSPEKAPLLEFLREASAPGAMLFTLLRKLFMARETRAAIEDGATQVVVLGAGYDPLALSLHVAHPHVDFYELDHPATQAIKQRVLTARQASSRLMLLPVDFTRETAEARLRDAGFRVGVPSMFICEGVLMYLAPEQVDDIFAQIRRLGGPQTRFAFTLADSHVLATDAHAQRLVRKVEQAGEAFRSSIELTQIDGFLARHGFRLRALGDAATLDAYYLKPRDIDRPVRNMEFAACAEADTRG